MLEFLSVKIKSKSIRKKKAETGVAVCSITFLVINQIELWSSHK